MSDTATPSPAPASPGSSAPSPKTHLRNIILGAITTIVGSTSVYYLTQYQNHKTDAGYLEIKEATTTAWKSYVTYENLYTKNSISLQKEVGGISLQEFLGGIKNESEKFQKDIESLSHKKDIDEDLVVALNRRIENEKTMVTKNADYITTTDSIIKNSKDEEERKKALVNEDMHRNSYYKGVFERTVNDIGDIAKILSERYGQQFSMNDFLVIQMHDQQMKTTDSLMNSSKKNNDRISPASHRK